jgi:heterodisulfide reductase subunit C
MKTRVSIEKLRDETIAKIEEISGQEVRKCFQCGKCTAGCPSIDEMDILPNQIMKLLQMGEKDEVLNSKTVWVCDSCFTCESRCPKGLDIAKVMEAVRQVILRTNVDKVKPNEIEDETYDGLPQAGIISCFKKFTG